MISFFCALKNKKKVLSQIEIPHKNTEGLNPVWPVIYLS